MNFRFAYTSFSVLILGPVLIGCGGSSGNSGATPAPPAFSFQAAVRNMLLTGYTDNVTVTLRGAVNCNGNGTVSESPATPTNFSITPTEQVPALISNSTFSWTWNDCTPTTNTISSANFYRASDIASLGSIGDEEYNVYLSPEVIPETIKAGDHGSLGLMTDFSDATETVVTGTETSQYSVASGPDNSSVIVTITTQAYDSDKILVVTDIETRRLSSDGKFTFVSDEVRDPSTGDVVTIRAY